MNQLTMFPESSEFSNLTSPEATFKSFTQEARFIKDELTSPKFLQNAKTYESSSSQPTTADSRQSNDFKAMSLALGFCLNTQTQMANALIEVGRYLKQLSEGSSGAMVSPSHKLSSLSANSFAFNSSNRFNKIKDKPAVDSCLQALIIQLKDLQTVVLSKTQEYEKWQGLHSQTTGRQSTFDHTEKKNPKESTLLKSSSPSHFKPTIYTTTQAKTEINTEGFCNSVSNIQLSNQDVPDDLSIMSKCEDLHLFETSQIFTHNVPVTDPDKPKPSKKFEIPNLSSVNGVKFIPRAFVRNSEYPKEAALISTSSATNLSALNGKKINVPPIKLKFNSKPAHIHDSEFNIFGVKKTEQKELQRQLSGTLPFRQQTLKTESECVEFVTDLENKPMLTNAFQTSRESSRPLTYTSPRERSFDYNTPKESARLRLNLMPKKEIIDEITENWQDLTMQMDSSLMSIDERPHHTPWMTYREEKCAEGIRSAREDSSLLIAKKERELIKALMKEQYGADVPSAYHKADHGKVYQKKYLISAKWWREWKDFVNFETEDDEISQKDKGSFLSVRMYQRPGPINNCELIRRDFITDPTALNPDLELKENLLEHHDYEAVSKKIHHILTTWYGADFEICRLLKPDPFHNNKPYLDLYPRKKQGKRQIPKSVDASGGGTFTKVIDNIISLNLKHPA